MLAIVWTAIVLCFLNKVNGSEFYDKYCEDVPVYLSASKCQNFTLPNEKSDYIISNSEEISIENANITAFNRNFINKLPNASILRFRFSTVNFTSEPVDTYHPLTQLRIWDTKVNGNRNTSILQSFEDLRLFDLSAPSPTKWMEYPSFNANFFKGNRKLEILKLHFDPNDDYLDVDFLEDGSLDALSNLKEMYYTFGRQTNISKDLFKNNTKLEKLIMIFNSIETIEKGALPSSLRSLDLSNNKIRNIQGVFTNLINLGTLIISNNKIEEINPGDFGNLGKLEKLFISNNKIKVLRLDHVKNIPNLRWLFAYGNDGMEWEKDLKTKILAKNNGAFVV